jgi:serine/threonine protein kinase
MSSETVNAPEGPRFGPYVLMAELGRGGMGVVYKAYDMVKGRTVALKVLIPELAADRSFQDRFRRESKRAARLCEPHIIPIHDFGQIDGQLFIDMRLVDGTDLAALLERKGPPPPQVAAWITAQVASALDAAHADGLVHRDVKPSNVLISRHGQSMPFAYLIDFGIARVTASASMATVGGPTGTLAYMAPERIKGSHGDRCTDVYSLACVLYECLTGQQPFTGEMVAVMWAQLNADPPVPSKVRRGLPPAVDEVIARGMAKDPARRYESAGELGAAILAATADAGAKAAKPEPVPSMDATRLAGSAPPQAGPEVPLWDSDPGGRAGAALRAIVSDPKRGLAVLSSSEAMKAALKDLLPGRQRETAVLAAAAADGLAEALRYYTARGMEPGTARSVVAAAFAKHTGFIPKACQWVVDELAGALGLDPAGKGKAR